MSAEGLVFAHVFIKFYYIQSINPLCRKTTYARTACVRQPSDTVCDRHSLACWSQANPQHWPTLVQRLRPTTLARWSQAPNSQHWYRDSETQTLFLLDLQVQQLQHPGRGALRDPRERDPGDPRGAGPVQREVHLRGPQLPGDLREPRLPGGQRCVSM